MNKFLPPELKDLKDSKERVMRNVTESVAQGARASGGKWKYAVMTGIILACSVGFVLKVTLDHPEPISEVTGEPGEGVGQPPAQPGDTGPAVPTVEELPPEAADDMTRPELTVEQGVFYLMGLTVGDSLDDVIERLGDDYTLDEELQGTGADTGMVYEDGLRVFLYQETVEGLFFSNVDLSYGEQLYREYGGIKFDANDSMRFIYAPESPRILKMTDTGDGKMSIGLYVIDPNFAENPGFILKPEMPGHSMEIGLNHSQPILSEAGGVFYLHGLTLGDSEEKVIRYFGEDYKVDYEKNDGYTITYGDEIEFEFTKLGKLRSIRFTKVDEVYFNHVLEGYEGVDLYSDTTSQMVSTEHSSAGDLIVSLQYAD